MAKENISIFFACDDGFVKFTTVTITSLMENASKDYHYDIHILYTNIAKDKREKVLQLSNETFNISFDDVSNYLKTISYRLPVRDYYSKTTYFRLFISEMFPQLDKALYVDSDTIVLGDISKLFNHDLGENYVGGCNEQAMVQTDVYGTYVEQCIGLDRNKYFNAGILLINCRLFREKKILDLFIRLLHEYSFVVTQDEDYLNLICKNKILWIDNSWNVETYGTIKYDSKTANIVHYLMVGKPWHFADVPFKDEFWHYAKKTVFYDEIKAVLDNYTDEQRASDMASVDRLVELSIAETNRPDNYLKRQQAIQKKLADEENAKKTHTDDGIKKSESRLKVLAKIAEFEKAGNFFEDVEDDAPARMIMPSTVDYEHKKLSSKIMASFSLYCARRFLAGAIKKKQIIIKDIKGIENIENLKSGAVITCNHFNAYDSFAIQYVFDLIKEKNKHGKFFRVINEANYTSYPGFYGFLMKNCNTLPLSSNFRTMNEFMMATENLLKKGNFVLIYPEQSMWWNYRKPKPLKKGAYTFASKAKVPVIPVFITMNDSDLIDGDGFPVQEYTLNICSPIYPKEGLIRTENAEYMMNENYSVWKKVYEDTYQIPLRYYTKRKEV